MDGVHDPIEWDSSVTPGQHRSTMKTGPRRPHDIFPTSIGQTAAYGCSITCQAMGPTLVVTWLFR